MGALFSVLSSLLACTATCGPTVPRNASSLPTTPSTSVILSSWLAHTLHSLSPCLVELLAVSHLTSLPHSHLRHLSFFTFLLSVFLACSYFALPVPVLMV